MARYGKLTILICTLIGPAGFAETFVLPPDDVDLIGSLHTTSARHEDTLLDIAHAFDVGQTEMVLANPGVDRWMPGENTTILIPSRYILPDAPRTGIVLNVPEMRLYYFHPPQRDTPPRVSTYPVSIGRMDWKTPMGTTRIVRKTRNPSWKPPESIRKEHAEAGDPLPEVVPPGPDNPLGAYALRLAIPGYLIHSTNKPLGIGMRVTHGCVRMYPENIAELFPQVEVGTLVRIVNQPIKVGWLSDTLFIEVHPSPEEETLPYERALQVALDLIEKENPLGFVELDGGKLRASLLRPNGVPTPIGHRTRSRAKPTTLTAKRGD